ncbi:unannotated protein [freshwater metagenome]|uniref:Unannotated protein n=1 Tax=freshwater metagenome TaxID=449393 RepID=A0A6J6F8U5_9ZZZZ
MKGNESKLAGRPDDEVFREARDVDPDLRPDVGEFSDHVSGTRSVNRVVRRVSETEFRGDRVGIETQRVASEGSAAVGRHRRSG